MSHEKSLYGLATGTCDWTNPRLDQPATKSPEQVNTVFENFDIFVKTKDFPKTTKTLKNLFVFDQQGLSM